jgi:hypothetical protein
MIRWSAIRPVTRPAAFAALLAALFALLALPTGCAKEEKLAISNLAPETYLAIADSIRNATVYSQTLTWWGDDRDGEVVAFEYRWFTDPDEPGCQLDTTWVRTEEKSHLFDLPVTTGTSIHRFEVRAIDNEDLRDPTPCRLTVPVTNSAPGVMIWGADALPDTTFPALHATWHGSDPEGDSTVAKYIVWLDGSRADAKVLTPPDTVISLGPDDFAGRLDRTRTLNLIAVDSGCDTSEVVQHTWYVRHAAGSILLVDDIGAAAGVVEGPSDRFYRSASDSCGRGYSVLDLRRFGGSIAAHNFRDLFPQFEVVVWYNDPYTTASTYLTAAETDIRDYIEDGGKMLLVSLAAIGSAGALHDSLWPEVLGVDSLFVRSTSSGPTTNFDCKNWQVRSNTALGLDTLKVSGIWVGTECMLPLPSATPLYYIPPGTITTPKQTEDYYLGIMSSWQTGKTVLLTFPLSRSTDYANAHREYCKIIDLLLD